VANSTGNISAWKTVSKLSLTAWLMLYCFSLLN